MDGLSVGHELRDGMLRKVSLLGDHQSSVTLRKTSGGPYYGGQPGLTRSFMEPMQSNASFGRRGYAEGSGLDILRSVTNFHGYPQLLPRGQAVLFLVGHMVKAVLRWFH